MKGLMLVGTFSFDGQGFTIDGRDQYLISGEFHYFRVPRSDWRWRMDLFREAGGNCLATYVPWLIHEPEEGRILFDDTDARSLTAFLETAKAAGLSVVLRPGPYQYSELVNSGLPGWLFEKYPQILAQDIEGCPFHPSSVSYLHPLFLQKARSYFRAFADVVRPHMAASGGPVVMLQVDNELTGVHVWYGSLDYHPVTMGFGQADGRYPRFLAEKYGTIEAMNAAYGTDFDGFLHARPLVRGNSKGERSRVADYHAFYLSTIAEYAALLKSWLNEDGLGGYICHNSANPEMNALFPETVAAMGEGFLLGSDHYYTLGQSWP
ncbi:MAG: beta-galactosidase [Clostridia bacterium]|nr:beta-galactosidase [Clostridia bacterium]